jgi:hypothetical protein
MPTPKQIAANRLNYLKYGNYSGHRIVFDESAEDPAELSTTAYPTERVLAVARISNESRLRSPRPGYCLTAEIQATRTSQSHLRIFGFVPSYFRWPERSTKSSLRELGVSVSPRQEPSLFGTNPSRSGIKNVGPNSPARVIFRTRPSRET